jgi:hypothetical protein
MDPIAELARIHQLTDRHDRSIAGRQDRYLYSKNMKFRYAFGRWWGDPDLTTTDVWVLLNPGTGDTEQRARPTLSRCVHRAQADGHSGILILNLFAFRHTDPRQLRRNPDPVGPANDEVLHVLTRAAKRTVVAWGRYGSLNGRSSEVHPHLNEPLCLGTTRHGEPRHPLYVKADTKLSPWHPPTDNCENEQPCAGPDGHTK